MYIKRPALGCNKSYCEIQNRTQDSVYTSDDLVWSLVQVHFCGQRNIQQGQVWHCFVSSAFPTHLEISDSESQEDKDTIFIAIFQVPVYFFLLPCAENCRSPLKGNVRFIGIELQIIKFTTINHPTKNYNVQIGILTLFIFICSLAYEF